MSQIKRSHLPSSHNGWYGYRQHHSCPVCQLPAGFWWLLILINVFAPSFFCIYLTGGSGEREKLKENTFPGQLIQGQLEPATKPKDRFAHSACRSSMCIKERSWSTTADPHESSFPPADQHKVCIYTQKPPNTSTDSQIYRTAWWLPKSGWITHNLGTSHIHFGRSCPRKLAWDSLWMYSPKELAQNKV